MLWIYCGLVVTLLASALLETARAASVTSKREPDYTLDESFWIEESPTGEVERLLREYTQNQEMVRNIGSHYYQIIYPVQLRQHKKMGISTREIGSSKRGQSDGYPRGRPSKTGKHFHRTSLLIKAFNHKFRLDLELNTQLIAPNLMQKHFLANGAESVSKQDIEHCYYHGTVQDYPGATAAFHTCNGVSGVIHVGNETFVIHPFYGGDLSKHPHVIFEARTNANKGCANSGNMEWRPSPHGGYGGGGRTRRDIRDATKYIETAIVIDKAMFEKRNGSTRNDVVHDSIQVANIADLYFRTLNTRVSVVYIETWQGRNQMQIDRNLDIGRALANFNDYALRGLHKVERDTTQLLTGEVFVGGEAGMAAPGTVCTTKAVGISVDINTYEPHLLAGTMAHMIGHNIGMGHDDGRKECFCRDWHGCIMAQAIVGLDNVQPYKFSECSQSDYIDRLRTGNGICLLNKPNELELRRKCGNRIVEDGEDCDCGSIEECPEIDPCCDPITCKLTKEAECASGPCCEKCLLKERGYVCREPTNECDLPEYCSGETGDCPTDIYKKNGSPCGDYHKGYCFNGLCPTMTAQCRNIWGYGGKAAHDTCFQQLNAKGSINGHCGSVTTTDNGNTYVKCKPENVKCGTLQCQKGKPNPMIGKDDTHSKTTISIKGVEYECKSIHKASGGSSQEPSRIGLVWDGTPCGENHICLNQTCSSILPHIDQTKCPTNDNNVECSGHGSCTNLNKCYCEPGWSGPDCSIQVAIVPRPVPTVPPGKVAPSNDLQNQMTKKETPYEDYHGSNTIFLVGTLMSVVGGVFIVFATMALCYRKTTVRKYEKPYKKPIPKNYVHTAGNHSQEDSLDNANKILSIGGSVSSFGRADSQRVLFRSSNHMAAGGPSHYQEHKMQQLKRMGVGSASEDDQGHSEEESVSFIDLQHNNLKLPEKKGILKKHDYSLMLGAEGKDGWGDGAQSEDMLNQPEASMTQLMSGSGASEVERTLKTLNGYHEDIIKALRNAASHRGTSTPSGSSSALSEELLRRSLQQCADSYSEYKRSSSQEKVCEPQVVVEPEDEDEDEVPPCGPIRIRNLEDLIRQLEHHSRHMSPSGSEDIRMSETEADRHYRQESSSACSESSHQSHRDSRFVYGRYRQPSGRLPYPHPHSHHQAEEESIYESADHDRGAPCGDTPDSESRWAVRTTRPWDGRAAAAASASSALESSSAASSVAGAAAAGAAPFRASTSPRRAARRARSRPASLERPCRRPRRAGYQSAPHTPSMPPSTGPSATPSINTDSD